MEENSKDMLLKVLYDLEVALKSKRDSAGKRVYTDEYIQDILNKLENAYDNKSLKLVKKENHAS